MKTTPPSKIIVCLFVLISLLITTSCSLRGTALRFADTLLLYQINKVLNLSDEQEEYLEPKIDEWIKWLKQEKLSNVIQLLEDVCTAWENGIDLKEQKELLHSMRQLTQDFSKRLQPDLIPLLTMLSDKQIASLTLSLKKSNKRFEKLAYSKDFARDQYKQIEARLEKLYGGASHKQIQQVLTFSTTQKDALAYLKQRQATQKFSINLLREGRNDRDKMFQLTSLLFTDPAQLRPKNLQDEYRNIMKLWRSAWIKTDQLMTQKQRQYAIELVKDLISDLEAWQKQ